MLSNKNVYDFKIQTLKDEDLLAGRYNFEEFYQPAVGEVISEIDLFREHLVLYLKCDAESYMKVINLHTREVYAVHVPPSMIYSTQDPGKSGVMHRLYQRYMGSGGVVAPAA